MAAFAIGALCLLTSACSSNSSPNQAASGTTTTTTTTAPSTTTTTQPVATSTVTGTPLCTGSAVGVSGQAASAAAGHQGVVLLFVNNGSASCLLYGYPGVAGLDASGAQAVQATRTPTGMMGGLAPGVTTPPKVTLSPRQKASAVVEGSDVVQGTETGCPSYPALLVTPPNTKTSVTVPLGLPGCSPIEVHPVVSGTSGSTQF